MYLQRTSGALVLQLVRQEMLKQIQERFAVRSELDNFAWLDLNSWPSNPPASFASDLLRPLYTLWEVRLQRWNIIFSDIPSGGESLSAFMMICLLKCRLSLTWECRQFALLTLSCFGRVLFASGCFSPALIISFACALPLPLLMP